jgi:AcrR family transcriptional regulator
MGVPEEWLPDPARGEQNPAYRPSGPNLCLPENPLGWPATNFPGNLQMPRPAGARNHDFDEKRKALLDGLTDFALSADLRRPSLRQFALAVQQSEPTLRHYFGDRQGLVIELLTNIGRRATPLWAMVATASTTPAAAFEEYFRISEAGMTLGGFTRAHAFGLIEGLADEAAGTAYLDKVLDPALKSVSDKLRATPGAPKQETALRAAALATLSPLLVMSLHQQLLGGAASAPIDSGATIAHLQGWLGKALSP